MPVREANSKKTIAAGAVDSVQILFFLLVFQFFRQFRWIQDNITVPNVFRLDRSNVLRSARHIGNVRTVGLCVVVVDSSEIVILEGSETSDGVLCVINSTFKSNNEHWAITATDRNMKSTIHFLSLRDYQVGRRKHGRCFSFYLSVL